MDQVQVETTVYSMSNRPPLNEERRSSDRHLTLYRVGTLLLDGRRELCLVKNISCGGALLRIYSDLEPGQKVELELKERQSIPSTISWLQGSDAGIEFHSPIDILELLSAGNEDQRPRMPRVEIESFGFIRQGAIVNRAQIKNISQGGVSAECKGELQVGGEVTVTLPGIPPVGGVVRWGRSGAYGISFNAVLALPTLVAWLQSVRERSASA